MRLAVLLAVAACSGPISPPIGSHARAMRAPANAPPDPLGTIRPGDRSCIDGRDCHAGERCYPPDYTPPAPLSAPGAPPPGVPAASPSPAPGAPPSASAPTLPTTPTSTPPTSAPPTPPSAPYSGP